MRRVRLGEPPRPGGVDLSSTTRALVLEAILDLPLGASLRDVAARIGRHVNTVNHHVGKLRKTGHVQIVKRGHQKRKVVVPVRLRLSETEAAWLCLGTTTARAIVVVARAEGEYVTSRIVAETLGWRHSTARYHLVRASQAGILEGRNGAGYALLSGTPEQTRAGLNVRAWTAIRWIAQENRRVTSSEVASAMGWTLACAKYHLKRAAQAGLLVAHVEGPHGGYQLSPNARLINWGKSNLAPA